MNLLALALAIGSALLLVVCPLPQPRQGPEEQTHPWEK